MEILFHGIDVSRWQGTIDWAKVKAAGVDFAFIRVGYCDNEGNVVKDIQYEANITGAIAAGMDVGVYLYSYATTTVAAAAAAEGVLQLIDGYRLTYPVAFDIEDAINVAMSPAENTAMAKTFLSAVAEAGYCPLLYTYKAFAQTNLNMAELAEYDFWLAHVTAQTNYTGSYTVWQYSWTGSVDGINGDVDLDYCYKDYPAYIRENGLNGFSKDDEDQDSDDGDDSEQAGGGDNGTDPETPDEPKDITYTVMKNDNLTRIAQRFGVPLRSLLQANPQIKNPNLIYVGDVVTIPRVPKS